MTLVTGTTWLGLGLSLGSLLHVVTPYFTIHPRFGTAGEPH